MSYISRDVSEIRPGDTLQLWWYGEQVCWVARSVRRTLGRKYRISFEGAGRPSRVVESGTKLPTRRPGDPVPEIPSWMEGDVGNRLSGW